MLNPSQKAQLDALLETLSGEQRIWVSGYLLASGEALGSTIVAASGPAIPVYFATETGNAKRVAQELTKQAKSAGLRLQAQPFNKASLADIAKSAHAIFISSTHGEGDMPEAGRKFLSAIQAASGTPLSNTSIHVLGLGDRAYKEFCKAAVDVEVELTRLGASIFHPITLLDVDFDDHTPAWAAALIAALPQAKGAANAAPGAAAKPASSVGYNRLKPVTATVHDSVNLNDIGSNKETYHIELTLPEGLTYMPGDAAGILLPNAPEGYTPRLYSIASSQAAFSDALHLTVAHARHTEPGGGEGFGVCSHYLAGLKEGDEVQFYIHRNTRFRLPGDDVPIIMIGPGTGIAPFRAFVQERDARGADGKNWLIFGDQHAHTDFLYQLEWQDYLASGALSEIDLAFSRDQKEKIYVQHRLQQKAQQLVAWLDDGAYLYVCGSKSPMSDDVEATLRSILAAQKNWSETQAAEYLEQLTEDNRYVKDVY